MTMNWHDRRRIWTCPECSARNPNDAYACECELEAERREREAAAELANLRDEKIEWWRRYYRRDEMRYVTVAGTPCRIRRFAGGKLRFMLFFKGISVPVRDPYLSPEMVSQAAAYFGQC